MLARAFTIAFAFLFVSFAAGCGGAKKKETAKRPDAAGPGEFEPLPVEPTIPAEEDLSTGVGIPSGDGDEGPPEHRMSEDARGIYNDAVKAAVSGNLAAAEQGFNRVLKMDAKAHLAAYNLGVLYERRGDDERAKAQYKEAFELQPNYVPALAAYAKLQTRRGKVDEAVELLRERATRYPKNLPLLNQYADTLIEAKRYKDAIAAAKVVLKIDERNATAMLRIGKANLRIGRFELAESIFDQVLKIDPDEAEVYFLRAFIRLEEGQKAAAIDEFKLAIEKRPTYVEAMNDLSGLYILSGNYAPAVELLEACIKIAPSWSPLHLNLGNALRGAGRWQEAKESLKRAQGLDASSSGAVFNLGLLYYVAHELDGMDRLARLNEAKRLFAQYKSAMGSALSKEDQVHKYLKEVQLAIDREQQRIQAEKTRAEEDARRAAEREAEASKEPERTPDGEGAEGQGIETQGEKGDEKEDGWY